jgi:hypothetical protein
MSRALAADAEDANKLCTWVVSASARRDQEPEFLVFNTSCVVVNGNDLALCVERNGDCQRLLSVFERPEVNGVIHEFAQAGFKIVVGNAGPEHPFVWSPINRSNLGLSSNRHNARIESHCNGRGVFCERCEWRILTSCGSRLLPSSSLLGQYFWSPIRLHPRSRARSPARAAYRGASDDASWAGRDRAKRAVRGLDSMRYADICPQVCEKLFCATAHWSPPFSCSSCNSSMSSCNSSSLRPFRAQCRT